MGFDVKKFKKEKFVPRQESVAVPRLAPWFEGDAVWTVRALEGNELGRCNDLADKNRRLITDIVEGIASGSTPETIEAVKALVGLSGDVPDENARRIEYLQAGSVAPICDLELAIRVNAFFPVQFRELTNKILQLTGQGYEVGKLPASGIAQTSKPV